MMRIGERAEVTRTYHAADVARFQALAGAGPAPAAGVPEPLIAALFSYLLGVRLPGAGTNYLKQELEFLAAAPLARPLVASVEITRLRPDKDLVDLETVCRTGEGTVVARGRALVLVRDVGKARQAAG